MAEKRYAESFYNPVTWFGAFLSLFILLIECFLFALDFLSDRSSPYLGLITYLILPPFLLLGLLLIPLGAIWSRGRRRKGLEKFQLRSFQIDVSKASHRRALFVFVIGSAIVLLFTMVGSYKVFHYTESVRFCGNACHSVMRPEYVAYQHSPHGRVSCVECHIGSGAGSYMEAKLSGLRQVYRVIRGTYDRPIKTPVENLRPASDTCLHCHWPEKAFGTKDFERTYYLAEQKNRPWQIQMTLQLGGKSGKGAGVHSHMNIDHDIYYAAEDERRQKITWVRSVDKAGKETVYMTKKSKFREAPPAGDAIRKMDCIDCHNRATHQFHSPASLLNDAMALGAIDPALPEIKTHGLALLSKEYSSTEEGLRTIREEITGLAGKGVDGAKAEAAANAISNIFSTNIFPEMKARWDSFPDNIGHMIFSGCFRCHDGKHESESGAVITNDCNSCHKIVAQGQPDKLEKNPDGLEFRHPDGEEDWKTMACTKCHTGGAE